MRSIIWSLALVAGLISLPAAATTFVMMSDEDLVDRASSIIEATVVSRDYSPTLGLPATDYMVEVDRLLKGSVPGSTLIVRVPGGIRPDHLGFQVFGAPRFEVNDRVLLFLTPSRDGTFRILHLMLGAFYELRQPDRRLAIRSFADTEEIGLPGQTLDPAGRLRARGPRDMEAFSAWISDRARGEQRKPDYFVTVSDDELRAQIDRFTLFRDPDTGLNMRWFLFDSNSVVDWRFHQDGQPGLTLQQVQTAIQRGIAAWNTVPNTNIRYRFAGTTTATGGLTNPSDGINGVIFEDPNDNILFGGDFSCVGGGTLAIGGPWFTTGTLPYQGRQVHRVVQGDIITNKGLQCFFDSSPNRQAAADELFGHELGHTLGFGHSCADAPSGPCNTNLKNQALMRALVHDDGRGARLNSDDQAAARALYGLTSGGPAAPSSLQAQALTSTSVQLTWIDNAFDEDSFQVEQQEGLGPFGVVVSFLPPNTRTVTLVGLKAATSYTYRVRARNAAGFSAYSNLATVTTLPAVADAPGNLRAVPVSSTQVVLFWKDNSDDELNFQIEKTSPSMEFEAADVAPAGSEQFTISGLDPETPYTFRVRAVKSLNGNVHTAYSNEASATTHGPEGPCVADAETLCLLEGRFQVRAQWRNQRSVGNHGIGQAVPVPGSDVTGMFWFFDASNIELIVKMLDGQTLNNFYWTFYGALSDVEYWISVVDTETQESVTYHNPPGEICGLGDVRSFPRVDDPTPAPANPQASRPRVAGGSVLPLSNAGAGNQVPAAGIADGSCERGPTTLCLMGNRFRVEVEWFNPRIPGNSGDGGVVDVPTVQSDESGFFWFFSRDNIELVVKILDGRALTGNFWFFWGGLSDVEYRMTVTDTVTGNFRVYENEPFDICGGADVNAL